MYNRSGSMAGILKQDPDTELCALFKYLTKHSVKEGLVDHPREWSGLHSYHQLIEGRDVQEAGSIVQRYAKLNVATLEVCDRRSSQQPTPSR